MSDSSAGRQPGSQSASRCETPYMPEPLAITHVGICVGEVVGAPDAVVRTRVVPDGREGRVIFARTLAAGEPDQGKAVIVDPEQGEELHLRPGTIEVTLDDVDRQAEPDANGYAPVTGTVWTWLAFIAPPNDPAYLRYVLAAARRLDTAYNLFTTIDERMATEAASFQQERDRDLSVLGFAELMCVALGRAIDMLIGIESRFELHVALGQTITDRAPVLREIRNAFEHIEDRALGQVRGRAHADAISVFDQSALLSEGRLSYAGQSLSLRGDILLLLVSARRGILDAVAAAAVPVRVNTAPVVFFGARPA
jgi:hypothetical protein